MNSHLLSLGRIDPNLRSVIARQAVFLLGAAFCLTPWATPPIALALGMALALVVRNPFAQLAKTVSPWLLQGCVVLLGFGMDLPIVLKAGANGALLAAGSIALTFAVGLALGRRLRLPGNTTVLISAGTAICGGSAIAAVGSVVGALEGEMTVAMGTVFLLNALALYLFPPIGHALGLSQAQFGTWAGIAIHDISSVVAAASRYGLSALQTATAVKLSRALWIVPVSLVAALTTRAPEGAGRRISIPWFIGLFLLASVARSLLPDVAALAPALTHAATMGLTLTLFLIGAGLSRQTLCAVGWKPLALGVFLWLLISAGSLPIILRTVH